MSLLSPIFVTGSTGFVGSAVVAEVLARGGMVHALVHRRPSAVDDSRIRVFAGDVLDPQAVEQGMRNCTAVIHLIGIIAEVPQRGITFERLHVESTRRVLDAARRLGIRRYVHMSALGARPNAVSDYHRTKWQAEQLVRDSGLDWTILRPSMIHGPGGEFMQMEIAWARGRRAPFLFMPYFGKGLLGAGGSGRIQPIFVEDVARAFVDCLTNDGTIRQAYDLAGPDAMDWPTMHATVARVVLGRRRLALGIPAWYASLLTRLLPRRLLPFNRDQVIMTQEDNTCDLAPFVRDSGWSPRPFERSLRAYAPRLLEVQGS